MKLTRKKLRKIIAESFNNEGDISYESKIAEIIASGDFIQAADLALNINREAYSNGETPPIDIFKIIANNTKARKAFLQEYDVVDMNAVDNMLYKFSDNTFDSMFFGKIMQYIAGDPKLSLGYGVQSMITIMNDQDMEGVSMDAESYMRMSYMKSMVNMKDAVKEFVEMLFIGQLVSLENTYKAHGITPNPEEIINTAMKKMATK